MVSSAPRLAHQPRLFLGRDRAEDARAAVLRHLHDEPAGAPRGRMHQAACGRPSAGTSSASGSAPSCPAASLPRPSTKSTASGILTSLRGRHDRVLGVRAAHHRIRDAIARHDIGDVSARRCSTVPAASLPSDDRHLRLVEAGAEVHVDEVDAAVGDRDQRLFRPRRRLRRRRPASSSPDRHRACRRSIRFMTPIARIASRPRGGRRAPAARRVRDVHGRPASRRPRAICRWQPGLAVARGPRAWRRCDRPFGCRSASA